jgi:hypothetical protein
MILPECLLSQFKENPKKVVAVEDLSDLWGSVQGKKEKKKACARLTPVHAKLPASHPGTSYNPQVEDHQDIIAEAVAVELRRAEASQMKDPLWAEARKKSNQSFDDNIEEDSESDSEVSNFKVKKLISLQKASQLITLPSISFYFRKVCHQTIEILSGESIKGSLPEQKETEETDTSNQ